VTACDNDIHPYNTYWAYFLFIISSKL